MTSEELRRLIAPHANDIGGPVTALRTLQQHIGWIGADAVDTVADVFNLSRAEVRGLVGFYADFRTEPPATHVLTVCQAEACQATGARELTQSLTERLGIAARREDARRPRRARAGLLPGALHARPGHDGRRRAGGESRRSCRPHPGPGLRVSERVYVPGESVAEALGAAKIAADFSKSGSEVTRNGSPRPALGRADGGDRARRSPHRLRARRARRRGRARGSRARDRGRPPRRTDARDLRQLRRLPADVARRLPGPRRVQHGRGRPAVDHRRGQDRRAARLRRRRLPGPSQVAGRRRHRRRPEVRRRQRRRGRLGYVRRPAHHGRRPVPADRGHDAHRRAPSAPRTASSTCDPSTRSRREILDRGAGQRAGGRHPRRRVRYRPVHRRRRLHLRRGDLAAREPGGQARRDPRRSRRPWPCAGCTASRPS